MAQKTIGEIFDEAYVTDNRQLIRAWKKEYREASAGGRDLLRRKHVDRIDLYDYIEQEEKLYKTS